MKKSCLPTINLLLHYHVIQGYLSYLYIQGYMKDLERQITKEKFIWRNQENNEWEQKKMIEISHRSKVYAKLWVTASRYVNNHFLI